MAVIKLIWCQDKNQGIGKNNQLPWKIQAEMQHFKNVTENQIVVMGRKTYQAIGKPLVNRQNIVLSKSTTFTAPDNVEVFSSVDQLLRKYRYRQLIIIGGKTIYEAFFPYADQLIISVLKQAYDCDTYLNLDYSHFELIQQQNFDDFSVYYYQKPQTTGILNVSIHQFSGPLDLLITLIKEKRYDLNNLDVAQLTEQYLTYVKNQLPFLSLDYAGDYLTIASDLVALKSQLLLAQEGGMASQEMADYQKSYQELFTRLLEYKKIRKCLTWLHKKQRKRLTKFSKPAGDFTSLLASWIKVTENLTLPRFMKIDKIRQGYQTALARWQISNLKGQKLTINEFSVEEVSLAFKQWFDQHPQKTVSFHQYCLTFNHDKSSLKYLVVAFVVILTLVRSGELKINLVQDEIWLTKSPNWISYEKTFEKTNPPKTN